MLLYLAKKIASKYWMFPFISPVVWIVKSYFSGEAVGYYLLIVQFFVSVLAVFLVFMPIEYNKCKKLNGKKRE